MGIDSSDIAKDNPAVWQGRSIANQDELEWFLDSEFLSDFLIIMLCWQPVIGGLPFVASADDIDKVVRQKVKDNLTRIEIGKTHSGLEAFFGKGRVICLSKTDIYVGTSDQKNFLELEGLLQIKWDYSYLDE